VIDVFCPLQVGMRVALCGALQVGTFVFMRELTQRLTAISHHYVNF
jgi:F0F1-type ATP synthase beta subunit